ncbi:hypothetical protein L4D77_20755 [Photobacterium frigidiphilum]|uniref:hypothetical protein n=1 Tax=Photobacterium frigidiphilum TaxID=264736 RepID=UPI003D13D2B8
MKFFVLFIGMLLQGLAVYIAFLSGVGGSNVYIATIISIISLCTLMTIRSLIAPVCTFMGILIGLSLSHNQADLSVLAKLEQAVNVAFEDVDLSVKGLNYSDINGQKSANPQDIVEPLTEQNSLVAVVKTENIQ